MGRLYRLLLRSPCKVFLAGDGVGGWVRVSWVCVGVGEEASGSTDAPGSGSLLFLCSVRQTDRVTPLTFASTR